MKQLGIQTAHYRYLEAGFKEWLDIQGYAMSTVNSLPVHVHELLHWQEKQGYKEIKELSSDQINNYYHHLKNRKHQRKGGALSNSYLNKHQQAILKFSEYLQKSKSQVIDDLELKREIPSANKINYLTQAEIKTLFETAKTQHQSERLSLINSRDQAILTIFYSCGLRRSEGQRLDISDLNFDRQVLKVRKGKGNKGRLVPFNKTSSTYLQDYLYDTRPQLVQNNKEQAFFIGLNGNRMQSRSLARRVELLAKHSQIEKSVHLHLLRHSVATHLLQNGMSLENIAKFLGHSSLESTQQYTHLVGHEL